MATSATMSRVSTGFTGLRPLSKPSVAHARRAPLRLNAQDPTAPDPSVTPSDILAYAKTMPGVSDPFPNIFDPLNFLSNASSVGDVRRWREAELTHGRVSMLASLGFIVQENLEDFPMFYNFDGHITGPAITQFQQVEARGAVFWEPLVFAIGICEAYRASLGWAPPNSSNFNQLREEYEPGNLGFDPLGLLPSDPKERYDLQTKELNNGRLAMISIAAFVAQELVEKKGIFEHFVVDAEQDIATLPQTV